MMLKKMHQVVNELLKHYPPDAEVWLDDENVMVMNNGEKKHFAPDDIFELENDVQINWDGIATNP